MSNNHNQYVGKIRKVRTPFYNTNTQKKGFKSRPGLVLSQVSATDNDLVIMPISKVQYTQNVSAEYDIKMTQVDYPNLNLSCDSYLRTHKTCVVNIADTIDCIADMKAEYPDLFVLALENYESFSKKVIDKALE